MAYIYGVKMFKIKKNVHSLIIHLNRKSLIFVLFFKLS